MRSTYCSSSPINFINYVDRQIIISSVHSSVMVTAHIYWIWMVNLTFMLVAATSFFGMLRPLGAGKSSPLGLELERHPFLCGLADFNHLLMGRAAVSIGEAACRRQPTRC
jgi:hypothetical protein